MKFREYGRDTEQPGWKAYIPAAVTLAAVGGYALFSKGAAARYMEQYATTQSKELALKISQAGVHVQANEALSKMQDILRQPMGYRESFFTALGNSWISKAIETAGKYVYPIGLIESIFKLPELRYAAREKVLPFAGSEMSKLFSSELRNLSGRSQATMYIRGAVRRWTGETWETVIPDVYPVKGSLSFLIEKIHRTPTDIRDDSFWNTIRKNLDVGNISKKYAREGFREMVGGFFGFHVSEPAGETSTQFLRPAHPVKEIMGALNTLASGDVKGAIAALSPGKRLSFFGKNITMPEDSLKGLSTTTLAPYHILNRMNQAFARNRLTSWIALSEHSTGSALDLYGSMFLKRALPLYVGYEYLKYINYEVGKRTGKDVEERAGDVRANLSLGWAHIKDVTGVTNIVKRLGMIAPEVAQMTFHPMTEEPIGLSHDELQEYLTRGREPIRKNRWWIFGSSEPFRGGKIEYFAPSWYQRTQSKYKDYAYTETRYGSKDEYWAHSWLPTFEHPLSPLRALTDPYWIEKKHMEDRPYPVTGPMFMDNIFGMPLNLTIGNILKPQKRMHQQEMVSAMRTMKDINEEIKNRFVEQTYNRYFLYTTGGGRMTPMESLPVPGSAGSYPIGGVAGYISGIEKEKREEERDLGVPFTQIDAVTGAVHGTGKAVINATQALSDMETQNRQLASGMPIGPYSYDNAKASARRTSEYINSLIAQKGYRPAYHTTGKVMPSGVLVQAKYPRPEWAQAMPKEQIAAIGPINNVIAGLVQGYRQYEHVAGIYGFETDVALKSLGVNIQKPPTLESSKIGSFAHSFYKDWNVGGLGFEFSEILRRFVPKKPFDDVEINLIPNKMPSWLPYNYGIQYHKGDPYSKIPMGEIRLPGAAYERAHGMNIMGLSMVASTLGADETKLVQYLLGMREEQSVGAKRILEEGTEAHEKVQKEMEKQGILISAEEDVFDKVHNIRGRIDAIVRGEGGKPEIVEIKTKENVEALAKLQGPEQQHIEQLMFYMYAKGIHTGYLQYTTREQPGIAGPRKIYKFEFQPEVMEASFRKLERARSVVRNMIGSGTISKEELYSPMERFRVLADVAPYSKEYEYYKNYLSKTLPSGEERKEFSTIKKEVSAAKKKVALAPYRFKYADIQKQRVIVERVLEPGVFTAVGMWHPIRLAGVKIPKGQDEAGQKSRELLSQYIYPGAVLTVGYAKDKSVRVEKDVYGSVHAAVWNLGGTNVARAALAAGVAKEKLTDYRPAAVYSRFTQPEIIAGKAIENISHFNILYFHSKFMPADSALESYKRKEIYGRRFTSWANPFSSMLVPAVRVHAAEGPVDATLWGAMLGGWLAAMKPEGKNLMEKLTYKKYGALIGAGIGLVASGIHKALSKGEKAPIPGDVEHRRELDEYYDRLKYIKFRRLYEATRRVIKEKEHLDIESLSRVIETKGQSAIEARKRLENMKRRDKMEGIDTAVINQQIRAIAENRRRLDLTPLDVLALQFREEYKSTMYGLDPYGSYSNIYKALPERERDYIEGFMKAAPQERSEILKLVPEDIRNLLKTQWYGEDYEPSSMRTFLKGKTLPSEDWIGWLPWRSLEDYKLATLTAEGADVRQEGYWPGDISRMKELGIKDIRPFNPSALSGIIKESLTNLYRGHGLEDVLVNIYTIPSDNNSVRVNVEVDEDREEEVDAYINKHQDRIFK